MATASSRSSAPGSRGCDPDRRRRGPCAAPAGAGRARAGAAPPTTHRMTRLGEGHASPTHGRAPGGGARARGSTSWRWPRRSPSSRCGETLERRKAEGLHARDGLHLPPAGAVHRPGAPRCASARALVVGRPELPRRSAGGRRRRGPSGQIARYAWDDHYALLKDGPQGGGRRPEGARLAGAGARRRQRHGRPRRRAPCRHRLVGQERQPAAPGARELVRARLGRHRRAAASRRAHRSRTAAGPAPAASTAAPRAPSPRRAWSTPAAASRGSCRPKGPSRSSFRVALGDRIYGCDDCQEVCPPNRRAPASDATGQERPSASLLDLLHPDDAVVLAHAERWYIPKREVRYVRRNALVVLGNVGDGHDPVVVEVLDRYLRHPDPLLRGHAVWAARRLGREDLLAVLGSRGGSVRAGGAGRPPPHDPPLRHQRLPAQGRRDPDDAVGAVAAAGPVLVRRADHAPPRQRRVGCGAALPRGARPSESVLLPTPSLARRIDALGRRDRRRRGRARSGPPRRAGSALA